MGELVGPAVERVHVERPPDARGRGDAVEGAVRLQLLEKPQPLLRERERQVAVARSLLQGRQPGRRQIVAVASVKRPGFSRLW